MHEQHAIASMPLYVNVDRINNELAALGISVDEVLTPVQLFPFDQYHYHSTDAVHTAVNLLGLGSASHVLDVGSGLGGPARYLASTMGCHVTALELQSELHALATRLTAPCGLGQHITHEPIPLRCFSCYSPLHFFRRAPWLERSKAEATWSGSCLPSCFLQSQQSAVVACRTPLFVKW